MFKPMNVTDRTIFQKFRYFLILVVCGVLLFSSTTHATKNVPPFFPEKRLTYGIKWGIIPVGEGVLSVHPLREVNGQDAYHFELKVTSYPFLDPFYKVRDKISSYVAMDLTRSYYYRKNQREGRTQRDIIVEFDWDTNQAGYSNFGKQKPPVIFYPVLSTLYRLCILHDYMTLIRLVKSTFRLPMEKNALSEKPISLKGKTLPLKAGCLTLTSWSLISKRSAGFLKKQGMRKFGFG
jgi:hypothetical protein